MIRISGGRWRGRSIAVEEVVGTRPTAARLREALFSACAPYLEGARVADLFAGSGGLGIEALSRGAEHVTFVELDPRALRRIGANLEKLGADPACYRVRRQDAWRWMDRVAGRDPDGAPWLVLADPPWNADLFALYLPPARRLLDSGRAVALVLEHPADAAPGEVDPAGLALRTRVHGRGAFTLFERPSP